MQDPKSLMSRVLFLKYRTIMAKVKHIIFLQSAHTATDERVLFHQAQTLRQHGYVVDICGMDNFNDFIPQITDVYIVDTPRALWKIRHTDAKIVYDITEWYPSKKNLRNLKIGKTIKALLMAIASIWAGWRADAFIFGEKDKAKPFQFLFPKKKSIFLSYYPDLDYIKPNSLREIDSECRVLYAGPLTKEKGWKRVVETMCGIAQKMPQMQFKLDVISRNALQQLSIPSNLQVCALDFMSFEKFCKQITEYNLFLDLRDIDFENTRCLPIKLLYYMACGKPSIYSKLEAIKKGVPEFCECVQLVDNTSQAVDAMHKYITDKKFYQQHCVNALKLSQDKYNWEIIKEDFIRLIDEL